MWKYQGFLRMCTHQKLWMCWAMYYNECQKLINRKKVVITITFRRWMSLLVEELYSDWLLKSWSSSLVFLWSILLYSLLLCLDGYGNCYLENEALLLLLDLRFGLYKLPLVILLSEVESSPSLSIVTRLVSFFLIDILVNLRDSIFLSSNFFLRSWSLRSSSSLPLLRS